MPPSALMYREHRPESGCVGVVRVIWSLHGTAAGAAAEPIVPDGCAELVFNVGDAFAAQTSERAGDFTRQPRAMLVGPTTRPMFVRPGRAVDVVGVRLEPWATGLLGIPARELRDRVVALDDLGGGTRRLAAGAFDEIARDRRLSRLQHLLAQQFAPSAGAARVAQPLVQMIQRAAVTPSVRQLAATLGRSARSVQRSFAEAVGIGPKLLSRLARVQRALRLAAQVPAEPWIRVAARSGYYDQAHFIREFAALVGMLPSQYRPDRESLTTAFVERS